MALREDIVKKVKAIITDKFEVKDITYVPKIENLTFGNTGLKFEATVLFIDMRGSTALLNNHNKTTVAKIHKAYFHTIVKIANLYDGNVRSFNGDSALVFFQGTSKTTLTTAVKVALHIKYMLTDSTNGISGLVSKYTEIDFGIGIDDGKVLCTKVGIGGEHNRDLIWIGNSVNKATVLSDKAKSPNAIYISSYVYSNLTDELLYKDHNANPKVNMWKSTTVNYNGINETCYYTSYHWAI
jgi:class 3 adenylate cyclase